METNIEGTYLTAGLTLLTIALGFKMGFGRIFGRATTTYHHARKSLPIQLKDGKHTSFADLCKSIMPPCNLNPFIFNGHLQTMWTVLKSQDIPVYYKRHIFENEDPVYTGSYAADFVVRPYEGVDPSLPERTTYFSEKEFEAIGSSDSRPMLVVLHGLSGGSHELYLRHVLAPLISEQGGWEAIVVNSRGCAMSKITSSVLYNARATWDVRQAVKWLKKTFPNRPLFGVGFSLGANIITNYVGEEGIDCVFKAALVLSNPWNLEAGSLALQRTWMGLNVYSRAMGNSMKALFETHAEQISKNPKIDVEAVRKLKYLHDFDREVQGPTWGYPTEGKVLFTVTPPRLTPWKVLIIVTPPRLTPCSLSAFPSWPFMPGTIQSLRTKPCHDTRWNKPRMEYYVQHLWAAISVGSSSVEDAGSQELRPHFFRKWPERSISKVFSTKMLPLKDGYRDKTETLSGPCFSQRGGSLISRHVHDTPERTPRTRAVRDRHRDKQTIDHRSQSSERHALPRLLLILRPLRLILRLSSQRLHRLLDLLRLLAPPLHSFLEFFKFLPLLLMPHLRFLPPRFSDLLQLPRFDHLALDLPFLLGIHQRQYRHHTLLVVDEYLALLLAFRLRHARGCDHVEGGQIQLLVSVDALLLLGSLIGGLRAGFCFHLHSLRPWTCAGFTRARGGCALA